MRDDVKQMKVVFVQIPLPSDVRDKFKEYSNRAGHRGMVDCLTKFIHECIKEKRDDRQTEREA